MGLLGLDRWCAWEAAAGARAIAPLLGSSYHAPGSPLIVLPVGDGRYRALEVTWQCSSLVASLPILLVAAAASLLPSARPRATILASAAGLAIVAVANQARIVLIAVATARWGDDGFTLSHRLVGSGLVLVSVIGSLALLVRGRHG